MACSMCDGYQLVPSDDGLLVDCPDCHAGSRGRPLEFCIFHASSRLDSEGKCPWCLREAKAATARLISNSLRRRASEAASLVAA